MASSSKRARRIQKEPAARYIENARESQRNRLDKQRAVFTQKKQPTEELFRKLPPEIRNAIYKLVLVDEATPLLQSGAIAIRFRRWRCAQGRVSYPYLQWQEPGLLKTAKWIRLETKLLYYTSHSSIIKFTSEDIGPLCKWIRLLVKDVNPSMLLAHFTLECTKFFWMDMPTWFPLAKLLRDFGPEGCLSASLSLHSSSNNDGRYPLRANGLKQVALLGLRAREQGWKSDTKLKKEFEKWTEAVLAKTKPVGKKHSEVKYAVAQAKHYSLRLKRTPDGYHCEVCREKEQPRPFMGKRRPKVMKTTTATTVARYRSKDPVVKEEEDCGGDFN